MEIQAKKPENFADFVEIIVRNAHSGDINEIYDIIKQGIPDDEFPPAKHLFKDAFEASPPWFYVLVAERAGHIVGCALYYRSYWPRPAPPGRALRLRAVCVRGARRSGVGTKLFRELCRVAVKENAQLNWSHPANNKVAAAFFAQFKPDISDDLDGTYIMRIIPETVLEIATRRCPPADVIVQPARPEDMAELSMMIREISETRGTSDDLQLNETDFVNDGFNSSPPWFFALIAWRGGIPVGTVIGQRVYNWSQSVDMQSLYVRPEARRCGLAKQLIIEFCRMVQNEGIHDVEFHSLPANIEAMALYSGFDAQRLTMFDGHVSFRLEVDTIKKILAE